MSNWGYGVSNGLMSLFAGLAGGGMFGGLGGAAGGAGGSAPGGLMSAGSNMPIPIAASPGMAGAGGGAAAGAGGGGFMEAMQGLMQNEGFMRAVADMAGGMDSRYYPASRMLGGVTGDRADAMRIGRESAQEQDATGAAQKRREELALRALERLGPDYQGLGEFATGDDPLGSVTDLVRLMRGEEEYQAKKAVGGARRGGGGGGGSRSRGRRSTLGSVRGGPGRLDDIDTSAPPAPAPDLAMPSLPPAADRAPASTLLGRPPAAVAPTMPAPSAPAAPAQPAAPGAAGYPGGPPVGTVEDGYRYIGGPPNDPKSWVPVGVS